MNRSDSEAPVIRFLRAAVADFRSETDTELLERFVQKNDHNAFELLVYRHAGLVMKSCRGILRDRHAAEDAAQAVFMAFARGARNIKSGASVIGWLHSVSRRVAYRAARSSARPTPGAGADLDAIPDSDRDDEIPDSAQTAIVHEEVARLPEKFRLPILLCYFEGLSYVEAANRLGWPIGTLNGRIAQAREMLMERLQRRGVTIAASAGAAFLANAFPGSASAGFIATTSRVALQFAAGKIVTGVSPVTVMLAKSSLRTLMVTKARVGFAATALSLLIAGGLMANSSEGTRDREKSRDVASLAIAQVPTSRPTLAPVPQKVAIPQSVIEELQEKGFEYGSFHNARSQHGGHILSFRPGKRWVDQGVPGFRWTNQNPLNLEEFPDIGAGFGLEIRSIDEMTPLMEKLGKCPKLSILILHECQLEDAHFEAIAQFPELKYLSVSSLNCKPETLAKLCQAKRLQSIVCEESGMNDEMIATAAKAGRLHRLGGVVCGKTRMAWRNNKTRALTDVPPEPIKASEWHREAVVQIPETDADVDVVHMEHGAFTDKSIEHLATLKNVREIHLDNVAVTGEGFEKLKGLTKLSSLTISSHNLTGRGLESLIENNLLQKTHLVGVEDGRITSIQLTNTPYTLDMVHALAKLKDLKRLAWTQAGINGDGTKALSQLTQLEELDLSQNPLGGIDELTALTNLQVLRVMNCRLKADDFKNLSRLTKLRQFEVEVSDPNTYAVLLQAGQLHTLDGFTTDRDENIQVVHLPINFLTDKNVAAFAKLPNLTEIVCDGWCEERTLEKLKLLPHVKRLQLTLGAKLNPQAIREAAIRTQIEQLTITCQDTKNCVSQCAALETWTSLKHVHILGVTPLTYDAIAGLLEKSSARIGCDHLAEPTLRRIAKEGKLHRFTISTGAKGEPIRSDEEIAHLILNRLPVTDATLAEAKFRDLTIIHLQTTQVTFDTFKVLAKLPKMRTIHIDHSKIRERQAAMLVKEGLLLKYDGISFSPNGTADLPAIRGISFDGCRVDEETLHAIVDAGATNVESLNLRGAISTEESFLAVTRFPKLSLLSLSATPVDDAMLKRYAEIKNLKNLEIINTKVTAAGVAAFKKLRPDCNVMTVEPSSGD